MPRDKVQELYERVEAMEYQFRRMILLVNQIAGAVSRKIQPLDIPNDPRFYWLRDAAADHDWGRGEWMIEGDPSVVHLTNTLDETALHYLVVENYLEAVEFLAKLGSDVNGRSTSVTPVEDAARMGHFEMVNLLIRLGAKVDVEKVLLRLDTTELGFSRYKKNYKRVKAVLQTHGLLPEKAKTKKRKTAGKKST